MSPPIRTRVPARHTCLRIDGTRVARIDVSARTRGGAKGHHIPLDKTLESYPLAPTPRARDQGAFLGVVLGPVLGEPDVTVPRGSCADPLVIRITGEVLAAHGRALAGSAHALMTHCGKEDGGILSLDCFQGQGAGVGASWHRRIG